MIEYPIPAKPGVYTLLFELNDTITIPVGGLGVHCFLKGLYTYTGSALGVRSTNLKNRINRHIGKKKKKKHWHIDHLLASNLTRLKAVVYSITSNDVECEVAATIANLGGSTILVTGFGSSDCHKKCQSHLSFFANTSDTELMANIEFIHVQIGSVTNTATIPLG